MGKVVIGERKHRRMLDERFFNPEKLKTRA
jgi:hypothetical protein